MKNHLLLTVWHGCCCERHALAIRLGRRQVFNACLKLTVMLGTSDTQIRFHVRSAPNKTGGLIWRSLYNAPCGITFSKHERCISSISNSFWYPGVAAALVRHEFPDLGPTSGPTCRQRADLLSRTARQSMYVRAVIPRIQQSTECISSGGYIFKGF